MTTAAVPAIRRPSRSVTVTEQPRDMPGRACDGVDLDRPSMARVNDYLLGGAYNLAVDRTLAGQLLEAVPDARRMAWENRAFLTRAVRLCIEAGVRQFLDLGSAITATGSVHQVAQRAAADARVLYVAIDPLTLELRRAQVASAARTGVIQAELRRPDEILDHPDLHALLDPGQPIAVLLVNVLHFGSDADDPHAMVARLRDRTAPGSHLVVSHHTIDSGRPDAVAAIAEVGRHAGTPLTFRTRAEIARLFTGFDMVDPGLVWIPQWRPQSPDDADDWAPRSSILAGVGRRP